MSGFFSAKETASKSRPDGKVYSCTSCGAYKKCQNGRMQPHGNFGKRILIVGDCPEEIDDEKGLPFQSKYGRSLQKVLRDFGVDLFEDCMLINAVNCRTTDAEGNNRNPTNYEMQCCRIFKTKVITEYKPQIIITLGDAAIFSIVGGRWKKDLGKVDKWRGFQIPDRDFNAWICPTFHPNEIHEKEEVTTIWEMDLKAAVDKLDVDLPEYHEPTIEIITDLSPLKKLKGTIAFDYETTGLKPHAAGHRIICASIARIPDHAYVFMMPESRAERRPFTNVLADPSIGKMAHNMKFEETWSSVRLKQPVANWKWDSMQAAHILDNRPGVTGLKFQTYVNFGVVDYDSDVNSYLQAVDDNNANSHNTILKLIETAEGRKKLLTYCGYDSIFEYRLAIIQQEIITPFIPKNKRT